MVIYNDNFFCKCRCDSYLIIAMFKALSQKLRGTFTTTFDRHFTDEDILEIDQRTC